MWDLCSAGCVGYLDVWIVCVGYLDVWVVCVGYLDVWVTWDISDMIMGHIRHDHGTF